MPLFLCKRFLKMKIRKFFTYKVTLCKSYFIRENGQKCFFDKDYGLVGEAFILCEKDILGSYKLYRVCRITDEVEL